MNNMIFYKANNNRSLNFQTKLYIIKELNQKKVVKSALINEAKKHVENIYKHSKRLSTISSHFDLNYQLVDDQVICDFVDGQALSEYLIKQLPMFNKENFLHLLDWFKEEVYTLLPTTTFDENKISNDFFKPYAHDQSLEYSNFINLDFNFDNIILIDGDYKVIDTEWVFEVTLPKDYVVYRSVLYLFVKYRSNIERIISFDGIMEYLQIAKEQINLYNQLEENFQQHVYGKDRSYNYFSTWCNSNLHSIKEILTSKLIIDQQIIQSKTYFSNQEKVRIIYEEINQYVESFEIQLLEKPAILHLTGIKVKMNHSLQGLDLTSVRHNASIFEDDYYTFLSNKPTISIDLNVEVEDILIEFEVVDFLRDEKEIEFISKSIYSQVEREQKISMNKLNQLNIEIDQIRHQLNLANGTIHNYHHPIKTFFQKIRNKMRGKVNL